WPRTLKSLNELSGFLLGNPLHAEIEPHRIEQRNIRSHRLRAIHGSSDTHGHAAQRNFRRLSKYLNQFHTTRGNSRQEDLSRRYLFAGTPVLFRPIDHEVVIAHLA